jgi:hypothetical protein
MSLRENFNKYIVFPTMSLLRYVYSSGQSAFPYVKFGKYAFKRDNHPATTALITAAIVANLGTNSVVKIPAMYRELNPQPDQRPLQPIHLRTSGKCVSALFKVAGRGMILLEFISGDFGVMYLLDGFGGLIGFDFHTTIGRKIFSQTIGIMGGCSSAKIFHSYEYAVVAKQNAGRLGKLFEDGSYLEKIRQNKLPLAKTTAVMTMTTLTYIMLAMFWTKSATDDFAEKNGVFNDTSKYIMCFLSAFLTLIFTLGWSPTAYDMFAEDEPADHVYQKNGKTRLVAGVAAICLPKDMLTWAVTTFMAVITNGEEFFDLDPYGGITGLATVCALTAGGFYGLSLLPGLKKTLADVATRPAGGERLLADTDQTEREAVSIRALVVGNADTLRSVRVEACDTLSAPALASPALR